MNLGVVSGVTVCDDDWQVMHRCVCFPRIRSEGFSFNSGGSGGRA